MEQALVLALFLCLLKILHGPFSLDSPNFVFTASPVRLDHSCYGNAVERQKREPSLTVFKLN